MNRLEYKQTLSLQRLKKRNEENLTERAWHRCSFRKGMLKIYMARLKDTFIFNSYKVLICIRAYNYK